MVVVITSWVRGGTSYMRGQRWGAVSLSTGEKDMGMLDSWGCSTIDSEPFRSCAWFGISGPGYITQSCYDSLNDAEKTACPSLFAGIIANSGYYVFGVTYGRTSYYKFNHAAIVKCWSEVCFTLRPDLHCEGVVCDPICIGADKYSQACATEGESVGECVFDQVIEANSPDCPGYDPCLDVECPDKCVDYDLYSQVCDAGVCVRGVLIEADNREICNYDPCRGVDCPDECFGEDKWRMECEEGECLPERIIEPNSSECGYVPPDPCEGVVCEDVCDNTNLHESVCDGGSCVRGRLIETDSPTCGYIPPPTCNNGEMRGKITCEDGSIIYAEICENNAWIPTNATCPTGPTPDPEPDKMPWDMILLAGIVIVLFYLFMVRR